MAPTKVILLACGSFNPPTNMHLRMFEIARDHLHRLGNCVVIGGLISPVHDAYGKKDLASATHRLAMLKLALQNSDWIKLSDWECKQEAWQRTRLTLQHYQNQLNASMNACNNDTNVTNNDDHFWIPDNVRNCSKGPVQVKLLCGADLLESFGTPGLWSDDDIDAIVGQHGLVVVTRENTDPSKFIYDSDVLTKYYGNITMVTEWIRNEVSSTKIRCALRRSESVKYLIPDKVIEYIQRYSLYGCKSNKYLSPSSNTALYLLTPSPTDISMESPASPQNENCNVICNNNIFQNFTRSSTKLDNRMSIDTVDTKNKTNSSATVVVKHPGQAVKIITESGGHHTIVKHEKVRRQSTNDAPTVLKSSKSCTNFTNSSDKRVTFQNSRSNSDLDECKSCDENLVRFIFTRHGIQVISDVETIV